MHNNNEKIINSFWSQRLSNVVKKYGAKTTNKGQPLTELSDSKTREEYAQFVLDEVLKGIGDAIPKENFSSSITGPDDNSPYNFITAYVDIFFKSNELYRLWLPYFYIRFFNDTLTECCICLGGFRGSIYRKFRCENHQVFGKILADLYGSIEKDHEECKKLVAKSDKVQKIVDLGFQTIIENQLKGSKLDWAVTERENGKLQINVRLTPRKILTMIVKTNTFDNDYKQIIDLLEILNTLMNKKKVDIKIRGESYHDNIQWHEN